MNHMHPLIYQIEFGPFVRMEREKKHEWKSIRVDLDKMKESKGKYHKQQAEEERDAAYSQMAQNVRKNKSHGEEFNKQSFYYF